MQRVKLFLCKEFQIPTNFFICEEDDGRWEKTTKHLVCEEDWMMEINDEASISGVTSLVTFWITFSEIVFNRAVNLVTPIGTN